MTKGSSYILEKNHKILKNIFNEMKKNNRALAIDDFEPKITNALTMGEFKISTSRCKSTGFDRMNQNVKHSEL